MDRMKLEALAEAMMHYSGYQEPGSPLYVARNPGGLKAYSPRQARDEAGNRVFVSVIDGIQALLFDAQLKLEGQSRAHLRPTDTLVQLAESYNLPPTTSAAWVRFLRKALHEPHMDKSLALEFFLGE